VFKNAVPDPVLSRNPAVGLTLGLPKFSCGKNSNFKNIFNFDA